MLGYLYLVLGKEHRAVRIKEIGIGEVDMPLDADLRAEDRTVVVVAIANLDQSLDAGAVELERDRRRDLRPSGVFEPARANGARRTRDRVQHLLVRVAEHWWMLSDEFSRGVYAPLKRVDDTRIARFRHGRSPPPRSLPPATL